MITANAQVMISGNKAFPIGDATLYREFERVGTRKEAFAFLSNHGLLFNLENFEKSDPDQQEQQRVAENEIATAAEYFSDMRSLVHAAIRWKELLDKDSPTAEQAEGAGIQWEELRGANGKPYLCAKYSLPLNSLDYAEELQLRIDMQTEAQAPPFANWKRSLTASTGYEYWQWIIHSIETGREEPYWARVYHPGGATPSHWGYEYKNAEGYIALPDSIPAPSIKGDCVREGSLTGSAYAQLSDTPPKDAIRACLGQLINIHRGNNANLWLDGQESTVTYDLWAGVWFSLTHYMRNSRAVICKACGRPVLTQGERGKPREFCSDKCRKWWWRHPAGSQKRERASTATLKR